jgi:hypothetical protein
MSNFNTSLRSNISLNKACPNNNYLLLVFKINIITEII